MERYVRSAKHKSLKNENGQRIKQNKVTRIIIKILKTKILIYLTDMIIHITITISQLARLGQEIRRLFIAYFVCQNCHHLKLIQTDCLFF